MANRLASETSPYLRQHADNPVAWYPWGDAALSAARDENKPILLSVGYSACHWCHVMAHESFEDAATAALMNELFINIKVDREERPDLDKIYQLAHYLLTRRPGGWPLTMFLTPDDQLPFFGGTYFPKDSRHGLPAFRDLLTRVAELYRERSDDIRKQNEALQGALRSLEQPTTNVANSVPEKAARLTSTPLDLARQHLANSFDARHGGFGQAPKFPHPTTIERLLRHWAQSRAAASEDTQALHMVTYTLDQMCAGGLYDQLGGGFCRYSVDDHWTIPHFEKMLYDNGPLLGLYSQAYAATGVEAYQTVALETARFIVSELQAEGGGLYSTLDADSEGEEGKYYIWTPEEVQAIVQGPDYALVARRFGLDQPANFEGRWHLRIHADLETLAAEHGEPVAGIKARLDGARAHLLERRRTRVRPDLDDKVLTAWNALAIQGLARAYRHCGEADCLHAAERALAYLKTHAWRNGRLSAVPNDSSGRFPGYLDDYAFLLEATMEMLQIRWYDEDLALARSLAASLISHFADPEHGGFYFTADDHERLIQRPKPLADDATPSGNGIAALALWRLGHLLGDTAMLGVAEDTLRLAFASMGQAPSAHGSLLNALEEQLFEVETIILRGEGEALAEAHTRCVSRYSPRRQAFAIPSQAQELPEALAERVPRHGRDGDTAPGFTAYICHGQSCGLPITTLAALDEALQASEVWPGSSGHG